MKMHKMAGDSRHPRNARVLPPRRLDRLPPDPGPRPQGQAHVGPHGRRQEHRRPTWWSSRCSTTRTSCWSRARSRAAANGLVLIKGSVKDVKKYIVPRQIKEVESKNPMKASKKGAPAAGRAPRSSPPVRGSGRGGRWRSSRVEAPRSPPPPRRILRARRASAGFAARSVYKLEEIDKRAPPAARRATGCWTSAAARARGCSTRSRWWGRTARWSGSIAIRCPSPSPGARVLRGDIFTTPDAELLGDARRPSTWCCRTWRPTRPASARPIRRARRPCSRRRSRAPSGCWPPAGAFVGKLFQGPDFEAIRKRLGALHRGEDREARQLARAELRDLPRRQGLRLTAACA